MAETFDFVAVYPTQRLVNGIEIVEVMEATAVTKPHGVTFTIEVPKTPGWKDALTAAATAEARELESVFDI